MSSEIAFEDLKSNAKHTVKGLRYLYNIMDNVGNNPDDFELCLEMAQGYIKQIADDLECNIDQKRR